MAEIAAAAEHDTNTTSGLVSRLAVKKHPLVDAKKKHPPAGVKRLHLRIADAIADAADESITADTAVADATAAVPVTPAAETVVDAKAIPDAVVDAVKVKPLKS